MTVRTCVISVGAQAAAFSSYANVRSCEIRVGHFVAASRPAWATAANMARKTLLQMLPSSRARWSNQDGTPSNEFFKLVAEMVRYLDNMRGLTIAQVVDTVEATQTQVVAVDQVANGALSVANASADAINTAASVMVDNSLSGAEAVPEVDRYEARYG